MAEPFLPRYYFGDTFQRLIAYKQLTIPNIDFTTYTTPISGTLTVNPGDSLLYYYNGTSWVPLGGSGSGTVTSVGLSLPTSVFSITGSPVTISGTLEGDFIKQTANTVFAGPTSGVVNVPTFRNLVLADLPAGTGTVTSVNGVGSTGISVSGGPVTTSGTLVVTNTLPDRLVTISGGTGISIGGTYPSFSVTNTSPGSGNSITDLSTDVVAHGPGSVAAIIQPNVVTYGKIQQVTSQRLLGNASGLTANVQEIAIGLGLVLSGTTLQTNGSVGGVSSVSNTDGSLTISPTTGAVIGSLNTGHSNAWTAGQSGPQINLTDGPTVTIDLSTRNNFNWTIGGNNTLGVPTNIATGQNGVINITQDSTGSWNPIFTWVWAFPGGTAPVLTPGKFTTSKMIYNVDYYGTSSSVSGTNASPGVFTWTGHGMYSGQQLRFTAGTVGGSGITLNTTYFAHVIDANTFHIATSLANLQSGTYVNTSAAVSSMTVVACAIYAYINTANSPVNSISGTPHRITVSGTTNPIIDIASDYVGQTSITTLGDVTIGTWDSGTVLGRTTMTLGSDANYDMYYRNSSGLLTRLGNGITGQILGATTASAPSWVGASGVTGIVTNVSTLEPILGGPITSTGTLSFDYNYPGTFTALQTFNDDGIGSTPTTILSVTNTTAATSGTPAQNSPAIEFKGTAWNTSVSKVIGFREYVKATAAATPTGTILWDWNLDGSYTAGIMTLTSAGTLAAKGTIGTGASSGTTGAVLLNGTTSGIVTLSVADAAGTWTMKLPTSAGTNRYPLTTDGTGITSWTQLAASDLSNGITGSGAVVLATGATQTDPLVVVSSPSTNSSGYLGAPQSIKELNYIPVISDSGKHLYHTSGSTATYTIPSNASVAYPIGTTLTFINKGAGSVTISISSDTMYLAGTGSTGSRTLAQYGMATAVKTESTVWFINGNGLT